MQVIIRAIVEFTISAKEVKQTGEPEVEKFVGELVAMKSGEYENLYWGSVISAEELIPESKPR